MVIVTSAIFAAIANETDSAIYRKAITNAPLRLISAVTLLETRLVLFSRIGTAAVDTLDELIERAPIGIVSFGEEQIEIAFEAFKRYGKGQGHAARLNIVDCAAYALASSRDLPLLFKGNDFSQTNIRSALDPA